MQDLSDAGLIKYSTYQIHDLSDTGLIRYKTYQIQDLSDTGREQKIAEIGRFFGEKSDIGGPGKEIAVEKSEKKKIGDFSPIFPIKTDFFRKKPIFPRKKPIFTDKNRFLPIFPGNFFFLIFFLTPKICKKIVSDGFRTHPKCLEMHPPTTKPLMTLIIYNANFFYIILLFICS